MLSAAETNLHEAILELDARWEELDVLFNVAQEYDQSDPAHTSVCHAITVLLCSHMEGALKALSMAVVADINDNDDFASAPTALKQAFVRHVLLEGALNDDGKIAHAAHVLSNASVEINEKDLFGANHNPKATVIERYASHFGVTGILGYYSRSRLEEVFTSDEVLSSTLISDLRQACLVGASSYPYDYSPASDYSLSSKGNRKAAEGLFGDYLDAVLTNRHAVVHGNELSDAVGIKTLKGNQLKMKALVYGYVQIVGSAVASAQVKK